MAQHEIRVIQKKPQATAVKAPVDALSKARVTAHRETLLARMKPGQTPQAGTRSPQGVAPQQSQNSDYECGQIWKDKENNDEIVVIEDKTICIVFTSIGCLEGKEPGELWVLSRTAFNEKYEITTDNLTLK